MGTRHLICVVGNGRYRVAQYGQWDGYPSGQGLSILKFLHSPMVSALKNNLDKCAWVTSGEYEKLWKEFGVDINDNNGFVAYDVCDKFYKKHPQFSRDVGADILKIVAQATDKIKLRNDYDFSRDSLFCEWAYVIDFDKNTFEVYQGFNTKPIDESERFYSTELVDYSTLKETYYPVKLLTSFDLSTLPTEEEFLSICEPNEDEEPEPAEEEPAEVEEKSFLEVIAG